MILDGAAVTRADALARWSGWAAIGFGALLIGEFILTRDIVPALLCLAPLPIGTTALIHARTSNQHRATPTRRPPAPDLPPN